jgi:hypothetical protein
LDKIETELEAFANKLAELETDKEHIALLLKSVNIDDKQNPSTYITDTITNIKDVTSKFLKLHIKNDLEPIFEGSPEQNSDSGVQSEPSQPSENDYKTKIFEQVDNLPGTIDASFEEAVKKCSGMDNTVYTTMIDLIKEYNTTISNVLVELLLKNTDLQLSDTEQETDATTASRRKFETLFYSLYTNWAKVQVLILILYFCEQAPAFGNRDNVPNSQKDVVAFLQQRLNEGSEFEKQIATTAETINVLNVPDDDESNHRIKGLVMMLGNSTINNMIFEHRGLLFEPLTRALLKKVLELEEEKQKNQNELVRAIQTLEEEMRGDSAGA